MTCLFFSLISHAKILQDDHYTTGSNSYSWSEVCKHITKRESPLIEYDSISSLDCMGKKVEVDSFCNEKEAANPYYTRAVVSKDKKVKCYSGKRVLLKWQCEGKEDKYCKDEEIGCFLMKEKLAKRLSISHQSLDKETQTLKCYFDAQYDIFNLNSI